MGYLSQVIKFDHGYTQHSPPITALLEVLSEMDGVQQRRCGAGCGVGEGGRWVRADVDVGVLV